MSCDTRRLYEAPGGALTQAFCLYLRENPCPTYPELLSGLRYHIRSAGYNQRPQLTSSQAFDLNRPFLLADIIPNMNHENIVGKRIVRMKFKPRMRRSYRSDPRLSAETALGNYY